MTGLEKIVDQIKKEANSASEEKLAKTKQEVEQILSDAKSARETNYTLALEQVKAEVDQVLARGESAASLQERKMLLTAKLEIIQQIFDEALITMQQLPTEEYFSLLLRMIDHYSLKENGCIQLSKKDLDRIPDSFVSELKNRNIRIMEEPISLNGGFILSYGEILENCSFEALLSANREEIQDQIVRLIF